MQELPTNYLAEIGRQLATLSAFLGGFAISFIGLVLTIDRPKSRAGWVAGSAAVSAAAFAVAVVASTMLAIVLHPEAPIFVKKVAHLGVARVVTVLAFVVGIFGLLISLGLSGWIRSTRLGWLTSCIATVAGIIIIWLIVGV